MNAPRTARELAVLFEEIQRELSSARSTAHVLETLTQISVKQIDDADHAGVTTGRNGRFETVAATDDLVRYVDAIQYELTSGPCVDAIVEDTVLVTGDLRTDTRWPEFGPRAHEAGVCSMLSHRLYLEQDRDTTAALNFYSARPGAFADTDQAVAVLLATHGAAVMARAAAEERADNLTLALKNSREIGIAIGVLMNSRKVTREQGFDLLRMVSQRTHRKLAQVAAEVAETGLLPHPLT